jgi:hypothetical protein
VALAGAAVLLVLGTDLLDWFWPALLAGAAVAYALIRIRRRMLPAYRVAQLLDRKLGLNDSLATAWFLLSRDDGPQTAAAAFQIEQAERTALSIQPSAALPFAAQRKWIPTAVLLALALTLLTIRYSRIETLSLRPPLLPAPGAVLQNPETRFSSHLRRPDHSKMGSRAGANRQSGHSGPASTKAGSSAGAESGQSMQQNRRASVLGAHGKASQSFLRRIRDALAGLAANLRAHIGGKRTSDKNKKTETPQSLAGSQTARGRQGNRQASAKQARSQAAGLRRSQTSARRGSQPRSGIGSRNGDKGLKRAQELAAMGKLTEILGKRSADLTGDLTVQSAPGMAALRTPETGRLAQHQNLGGEIRRDQVPAMYRDYVKRYMEAVRNSPAH